MWRDRGIVGFVIAEFVHLGRSAQKHAELPVVLEDGRRVDKADVGVMSVEVDARADRRNGNRAATAERR